MKSFKPNLIPNNPKDGSFDMDKVIMQNGGYEKYIITIKKDGVRVQLIDGKVLSRSLEVPNSKLVLERFSDLAEELKELGIAVDAEFYMHGQNLIQFLDFLQNQMLPLQSIELN